MPLHPQNPTPNRPVLTELLQVEEETGQAWEAEKRVDMTSRQGRQLASYSRWVE